MFASSLSADHLSAYQTFEEVDASHTNVSARNDDNHDAINQYITEIDRSLTFLKYDDLKAYVRQVAQNANFQVKIKSNNKTETAGHHGNFHCWCFKNPPNTDQPAAIPNQYDSRRGHALKIFNHGAIRCSCQWRVHFAYNINKDPNHYHFTDSKNSKFIHTGHNPALEQNHFVAINSLSEVPSTVREELNHRLNDGYAAEPTLRAGVERFLNKPFDRTVFHNLLNQEKKLRASGGDGWEMRTFYEWAMKQVQDHGAYANIKTDEHRTVDRLFFMSADMKHNFLRNGDVIVMDTTMGTNRFGLPCCLLLGIDHHRHVTNFAVALIARQDHTFFEWIFSELFTAAGAERCNAVKTIFTDGDGGMRVAIRNIFPNVEHFLCWFHLRLNVKDNGTKYIQDSDRLEKFVEAWKSVIASETVDIFNTAKDYLHSTYDEPGLKEYLIKEIWSKKERFVLCYIGKFLTFGVHSTQLAESSNNKLKKYLQVRHTTPVQVLFERLRFATEESDRKNVAELEKGWNEYQLRADATHNRTKLRRLFTLYVTNVIMDQFQRIDSYACQPTAVANEYCVKGERHSKLKTVEQQLVVVTGNSMSCTCNFPSMMLIPCVHVMKVNVSYHEKKQAIIMEQIGVRWRHDYMPSYRTKQAMTLAASQSTTTTTTSPAIHWIRNCASSTVKDRTKILDEVYHEFRAYIVNNEADFAAGYALITTALNPLREKHKLSNEHERNSANNPVVATTDPTETPDAMYQQQSNIHKDPPAIYNGHGKRRKPRIKSKGEEIKKAKLN